MRFRRRSGSAAAEDPAIEADPTDPAGAGPDGPDAPDGPYDVDDLPEDGVPRVDLGSLLVAPGSGRELRVQVDQKSGTVKSVLLAGQDGALELRAFAAPRNGDLWSEIRPQIAADATRRGGTATEREGRFGIELVCEVQVTRKDGDKGVQASRVIGINGSRWLLRATLLGSPAREPEQAAEWEDAITRVAVRRGADPMPVGEALPLALPEGVGKSDDDDE